MSCLINSYVLLGSLVRKSSACAETPAPKWRPMMCLPRGQVIHSFTCIEEKRDYSLLSGTYGDGGSGTDPMMKACGKRVELSNGSSLTATWADRLCPVGSGHSTSTTLSTISDSGLSSQHPQVQLYHHGRQGNHSRGCHLHGPLDDVQAIGFFWFLECGFPQFYLYGHHEGRCSTH